MKPNELMLPPTRWGFRIALVALCLSAAGAAYLLFCDDAVLQPAKVRVIADTGMREKIAWLDTDKTARVHRAGAAEWENAPKNTELDEGDRVFLPEGARGSVIFYGPPGTKGRERTQPLFSGRVYQIFASDVASAGPLAGEGTAALGILGQPEYTYEEIERAVSELRNAWNSFQKRSGERGKLKPISGGGAKLDRIDDFAVELSVSSREVRVGEGATLSWSPVPIPGVSYVLQVGADESFKGAMRRRLAETQSPVNFKREGKYFIRVIASKGREAIVSDAVAIDVSAADKTTEPKAPEPHEQTAPLAQATPSEKTEAPASAKKPEIVPPASAKPKAPKRVAAPAASRRGTEPPAAPESLGSDLNGFTAEVATDPAFRDIVASALTTEARCPKSGLQPGTYYCRLTPIQGNQTPRNSKFVVKGE